LILVILSGLIDKQTPIVVNVIQNNMLSYYFNIFGCGLHKIFWQTVVKFIIKSSLLLLPLNKAFSAGAAAERCATAHS
jgi:hypothetical protein